HRASPDGSFGHVGRFGGRMEIAFRTRGKLLGAARTAEMVGVAVVLVPVARGGGVDVHPANRVLHGMRDRFGVGVMMAVRGMRVTIGHGYRPSASFAKTVYPIG